MRARLILVVSLFIVFTFVVLGVRRVCADEVDAHFETARGGLLTFYGSEIVAHTAVLLGIIIALPSVFSSVFRRLNDKVKRPVGRAAALYVFYFLILMFIFILILYSLARIVYYSSLVSNLVQVTRERLNAYLHANITELNLTSLMDNLSSYTQYAFWHSVWTFPAGWLGLLALQLYPDNLITIVAFWAVPSIVMGVVWTYITRRDILTHAPAC
jgi:hypothetical protein